MDRLGLLIVDLEMPRSRPFEVVVETEAEAEKLSLASVSSEVPVSAEKDR